MHTQQEIEPETQAQVREHARLLLRNELAKNSGLLTTEIIRQKVSLIGPVVAPHGGYDTEQVVADLESIFNTYVGQSRILDGQDAHVPWLLNRKANISWDYWSRYRSYLQYLGMAEEPIQRIDELTDEVLSRLEDPTREGAWDRRGMVVGHVQSGKTANYTGLICKAADAGYSVIVVLAGLHNNLRSQTQIRLDEGFLGFDSSNNLQPDAAAVGVGTIAPNPRPNTITTRQERGDFSLRVAKQFNIQPGGRPLLFVVKKNASVLRNLVNWVEWAANAQDKDGRRYVRNVPLLVIDDEADHGSVDTRQMAFDSDGNPDPDHDPTALNQLIRRLLAKFEQSAYVGYTATPYANIFIHERGATRELSEDLFPRSFIISIPTPSNYFGPVRVFGLSDGEEDEERSGLPILRIITDATEISDEGGTPWMPSTHKSSHVPVYNGEASLPPSLMEAMYCFLLAIAARRARGQEKVHNSMLVHVTRFVAVQGHVFDAVKKELALVQDRLRFSSNGPGAELIAGLKELWHRDFVPVTEQISDPLCPAVTWEQVEQHLIHSAVSTTVRQINGSAGDVLDYTANSQTGLNIIAVGGDKLSRGLTLEGLTVSYFLRASKMYDTLMQMGRWFGYRPNYYDLCRLYTTSEVIDWYRHITAAGEELRREFDHMAAVGGTPKDYGLRVRSHPDLLVTSRVKMRHGTSLDISFSGDISETIAFYRSETELKENCDAMLSLLSDLEACGATKEIGPKRPRPDGKDRNWKNSIVWTGVRADAVVTFLNTYKTHPSARKVNCRLMADYIQRQNAAGHLVNWTVGVLSGEEAICKPLERFGSSDSHVRMIKRSWFLPETKSKDAHPTFVIRRLVSPPDEAIDLTLEQYRAALEITRTNPDRRSKNADSDPTLPSGRAIRSQRSSENGLLLLYPIDPRCCIDTLVEPIVGIAISFPDIEGDKKVTYVVDNVYHEQEFGF